MAEEAAIALVDTHTHLNDEKFAADVEETIARARAAGVTRLINMGDTLESSERAVTLAAGGGSSRVGEPIAQVPWSVSSGSLVAAGDLGEVRATTAADGTAVGTWPTTVSFTPSPNYAVTTVDGTYRVSAATLSVTDARHPETRGARHPRCPSLLLGQPRDGARVPASGALPRR